ncbi:MAG: hypothetical protein J0L50_08400 [Sphingomonadales bacterium]|nr:hypothetical protein [Sphingomonadales bacterium]
MGMLDGILGQLGGQVDIRAIAQQVGIDPAMAEKAVAALGQSHAEPGDTLEGAAAKTGLDIGQIGQIAEQLGGAGALEKLSGLLNDNPQAASILNMLDRDGDGNPLDDIAGMASSLFGKK